MQIDLYQKFSYQSIFRRPVVFCLIEKTELSFFRGPRITTGSSE
jgi:hypothetical protein